MIIYEYPTFYIHQNTLPNGEIISRHTFPLLSENNEIQEEKKEASPLLSDQEIKKALLADLVSITQSIQ
jgi:hypothetical protein